MTQDLTQVSAAGLARLYRKGKASPVETMKAVLARADKVGPRINALCRIDATESLAAARASEKRWKSGKPLSPLDGVPVSIKELVRAKGWAHSMGSKLTDKTPADADAPAVARLREAGAIVFAQSTSSEYGHKGVTDSALHGITRNPWNTERTPGGSSGGAGAAVAAGLAPLAIGTDGGGSIRKPASFTGIVGFKASYGRVPVYPASAAWSLSHVGPMTRTVKDAALMMNVCAGPDERDPYSLPAEKIDYVKALAGGVKGLRVAYSDTLGIAPAVDPEVRVATARAARAFRALGCRVEHVNPTWPSAWDAWRPIFLGGIATRMAPYMDRRGDIDAGLLPVIEETLAWGPTRYVQAWFDRLAWWQHPRAFFEKYDLLLTPTATTPAFEHGILYPREIDGVKVDRHASSVFTYPFNLTGQPAISVPCGFTKSGLPIGLQIVGRRFDDTTVLRAAAAFEAARPWTPWRPPLD